jgi:hypothetical protein
MKKFKTLVAVVTFLVAFSPNMVSEAKVNCETEIEVYDYFDCFWWFFTDCEGEIDLYVDC